MNKFSCVKSTCDLRLPRCNGYAYDLLAGQRWGLFGAFFKALEAYPFPSMVVLG